MAIGFCGSEDFSGIVGWSLDQVTIDKYHVMFWFNDGMSLLNVADKFSYRSSDGSVDFIYEVYGKNKFICIDAILRSDIVGVSVFSGDRLDLLFDNGDVLSVYDNPRYRSWWFMSGEKGDSEVWRRINYSVSDLEYDDLTDEEIACRIC